MKRKMLFMAALAGLVVLGSCVKDDESASVTAIRNAKAAQLSADATLKTAQAAYNSAQAAHELADANYRAAEAAIKEGASAEEIAKNKADYKKDAADFAAQEIGFIQQLAADNEAALSGYVAAYRIALNNYNVEQAAYIQAKSELAIAKSDPEAAMKQVAGLIQIQESNIKAKEAYIEALKSTDFSSMTATEKANAQTVKTNEKNDIINKFNSSPEVAALIKASKDFIDASDAYDEMDDVVTELNTLAVAAAGVNVVNWAAGTGLYPEESGTFFDYATYQYNAATSAYDFTYLGGPIATTYNALAPYPTFQYGFNEANKKIVADFFEANVQARKDTYDQDVDLLGTEDDKADTTTKLAANNNQLTLYAILAGADAEFTTENDSLTKVQAKYDAEMAKLVQAYKDLAAANALAATDTTKPAKTLAAQKVIGEELIKLYGEFTPAIALAADGSNIDAYVFGTSGITFNANDDYTAIKTNVETNFNTDGTRTLDKIVNELGAQGLLANAAEIALNTAKDNVVAQINKIENPATGTKVAYDNALTAQIGYEEVLTTIDLDALNEYVDELSDLMDAWDEAMVDVEEAKDAITNVNAEIAALNAVQTTVDIDKEIADAEASISTSKEAIETLKAANDPDVVIAQLEQDLAEQEGRLYMAAANLAAAKASLEAILKSLGLDIDTEG